MTVLGLNGVVVSGTPTNGQVLTATSANTCTWAAGGGGGVTWAGDLVGSTSSSQAVVSLTGSSSEVVIFSSAPSLTWAAGTTAPTLTQIENAVSGGQPLTIQAQSSIASGANGGSLNLTAGNCGGGGGIGGNVVITAGNAGFASAVSGVISIPTAIIENQPTANAGTYSNIIAFNTTSSSAHAAQTVYTVPFDSIANITVTIMARTGTSGGGGSGVNALSQSWTGKCVNSAGSLTVFKAFAPIDALDTNGTLSAASVSVANSGTAIQVTVTPGISTSTNWVINCAVSTGF